MHDTWGNEAAKDAEVPRAAESMVLRIRCQNCEKWKQGSY